MPSSTVLRRIFPIRGLLRSPSRDSLAHPSGYSSDHIEAKRNIWELAPLTAAPAHNTVLSHFRRVLVGWPRRGAEILARMMPVEAMADPHGRAADSATSSCP
jgi:hypothetical protein